MTSYKYIHHPLCENAQLIYYCCKNCRKECGVKFNSNPLANPEYRSDSNINKNSELLSKPNSESLRDSDVYDRPSQKEIPIEYYNKYGMGANAFKNTSINCYGISGLQALLSIDVFNRKVIEIVTKLESSGLDKKTLEQITDNDVISKMCSMYYTAIMINAKLYRGNDNYLVMNPSPILRCLTSDDDGFGSQQEDAHEFLMKFLDKMKQKELEKLFEMRYKTESFCLNCKKLSYSNDNEIMMQVNIQEDTKIPSDLSKNKSLRDVLENRIHSIIKKHISVDSSKDYKCEKCMQNASVMRVFTLLELNQIITIYFMDNIKNEKNIPEFLEFKDKDEKPLKFKLVAMINQFGNIAKVSDYRNSNIRNSGHYNVTAVRRSYNDPTKTMKVFTFDDEHINYGSFKETKNAYILFYEIEITS